MTGRMSYVDLAWPWGLVTLGLQPLLSPAPDQVQGELDESTNSISKIWGLVSGHHWPSAPGGLAAHV